MDPLSVAGAMMSGSVMGPVTVVPEIVVSDIEKGSDAPNGAPTQHPGVLRDLHLAGRGRGEAALVLEGFRL